MVVSDESKGGAPKKLSTKDILAAARAQAEKAAGGVAPQASAPAEPAQATSPAPVADTPAAKSPAKPAPKKSDTGKKPTSTADILAAARAQAAGAAAPAENAPAAPKAAPVAKPATAKPATGGIPKSTAEILAAARAAAAGGASAPAAAEPVAGEKGAGEKPAAKEKPSKATVAKAAPAATGDGPRLSVQEMLAAVRPGGVAPTAEAPAALAKPAKPTVAPPMPPKPAPAKSALAKSDTGKPAPSPAPDAGRRNLLVAALLTPFALMGGLFSSAFAAAWTMLAATTGIATLATARFMLPNVLTEPPSKFKIGSPSDFDLGTVATRFVATNGIWVVHTEGYKGKNLIYALISVCTHLGCTPSWLEGERKFKCPCHGSGFYITGINFEGPAPRPLERAGIRLAEDGMLEVDKSVKFQEEMGQWNDPTSYYEVVG